MRRHAGTSGLGRLVVDHRHLLPTPRPKPDGGQPTVPPRAAAGGILFELKSGISWEMLPAKMGYGSGATRWRRLRDWQLAGVWERLPRELLRQLRDADRIDWSRAYSDSRSIAAKRGRCIRAEPDWPGTKRHFVTDRAGIPLAFILTGASPSTTSEGSTSTKPSPQSRGRSSHSELRKGGLERHS